MCPEMKQLDRLLLFQGNRCFFCDQPIPAGEASVEHLVATANGGNSNDENCVACCKTLNAAFGHLPYKEKLRVIINHRGQFTCPRTAASASAVAVALATSNQVTNGKLAAVLADLQKRGSARPRKLATLRNTVAAVFQKQTAEDEVNSLIESLSEAGHIVIKEEVVTYNLPARGA
jgi:hypothetical protein